MGKTLGSPFTLAQIQFGTMNLCIYPGAYEFLHMNLGVRICAYEFVRMNLCV